MSKGGSRRLARTGGLSRGPKSSGSSCELKSGGSSREPKMAKSKSSPSELAKLTLGQKVGILLLIIVLSGFIGWLWEFIVVEIKGGFSHLYINGGNLLPWMNIYAYGAIVIILVAWRLRRWPWAVFIVSALAAGLVELFGGWLAYVMYDGARYWDYSNVWWGFGNIGGFVCPVSVMAFGLLALVLIYGLLPFCIRLALKMNRRAFLILAVSLFTVVMIDDITNLTLKNMGLPTAMDFYESLGMKYYENP